jgi:predicted Zn-dependent peptidase
MNRTDIDGVRVLWEDAPAPFSASLVFGVGARHETFRTVGVTHFIEHLVMATLPKSHLDHNAQVDAESTIFHASGSAEAVVDFISAVCAAIGDLPLGRLGLEAGVLEAEGGSSAHPAMCAALTDRFGFEGIGLLGTDGAGVQQITAQQVTDHLRRYFVRGNAVLVLTGPPPAGLTVPLPPGVPPVPVAAGTSRQRAPGRLTYGGPMPSLSIEVESVDDADALALMRILVERMTDCLRHRQGLAYEVGCSGARVDETRKVMAFWADGREGHLDKVATGLWETLRGLAAEGPTLEEIAHDRAGMEEFLGDARATQERLEGDALRLLQGRQPLTAQEARAAHDGLTPAHLQDLAARSLTTALLQLPEDVEVDLADLPVLDGEDQVYGDAPVSGRTHRKRSLAFGPFSLRAVVGDTGASLQVYGDTLTVLWEDIVGLGTGPHERVLLARDGAVLELCSKHFRGADDLFATIDSAISTALRFELPGDRTFDAPASTVATSRSTRHAVPASHLARTLSSRRSPGRDR